jgi:acyl-CoA-dependent ceramide synthase
VASLRLIMLVVGCWLALQAFGIESLSPFIMISYALPLAPEDEGVQRYGKGLKDLAFLAFYILVFSFIRQAALSYIISPIASRAGIKGERKLERFNEQGYALMYWSTSSIIGLVR